MDITPSHALTSLEVTGIDLLNGAGEVVARAVPGPDASLRRDSEATLRTRQRWDTSDTGTVPFDGQAEAGKPLRLHAHAPLDTRLEALGRASPRRFRARVQATGEPPVVVEGELPPSWSTAGPAGPP